LSVPSTFMKKCQHWQTVRPGLLGSRFRISANGGRTGQPNGPQGAICLLYSAETSGVCKPDPSILVFGSKDLVILPAGMSSTGFLSCGH
jgi:hypothetical protein